LAAILGLGAGHAALGQTPARPAAPARFPGVTELDGYSPIEVVAGAPGTHPLTVAAAGDTRVPPQALATAQAYSDAHAGHALIVWQGGKLRYERYGEGISQSTRFETFSMHKSVLGLVYGAALRDGVIGSLDDKASVYLREWRGDPRGDITLRQLLTMETGLRLTGGDTPTAVALADPLDRPAGARFEYNNINPQLAGAILNRALKASGRGDYAAYVSKVLLQPLGAGDAHLWLDHEGGDPHFYAFFQARARDWLRIGITIDRGGRFDGAQVLPAAWIKTMTARSPLNPNYGMLVWIGSPWSRYRSYGPDTPIEVSHQAPYKVDDLVFFDGFGGERVYISPSLDLVIVRIGESDLKFDDSIIPNAIIEGLTKAKPAAR
jgi:CubicO group peptidase (beta-lactamase class C family)